MTKWGSVSLKDIVDPARGISYGIVQPGSPVADGVPILRVSDIRNGQVDIKSPLRIKNDIEKQYSRTKLRGGELLITIVGTIGETVIVPPALAGWNVARAVAVLPINTEVGPYWVQLSLKTPAIREFIDSRLNTTVQATLNLGDLAKIQIPIPPERERQNIESMIGALENKIDLNRRMNETLEAMAQAIFKDWFVDFGPTRAKMEGRTPYLASEIWALFPDRLDDEGRPEGWMGGTLGDLAEQVGEGVNPETLSPETPYIGLEHMPRCSIALDNWEGADKVSSGKIAFKRGDFLFGKLRPYFHKVGIAPIDGICSTDIVVLNAKIPSNRAFVILCISRAEFVAFTDQTADGTKMPRTSWGRMAQFEVCVPESQVLESFQGLTGSMFDRIVTNVHESRNLAKARNLLLPKLMSGEIRLRNADRQADKILVEAG